LALDVIGAGFGRTGTLSLKVALEQLGFGRCYHMMEVFAKPEDALVWSRAHRGEAIDWDALFEGYRSSVDWPACNLWREQLAQYPEARVLLSVRDPESWYQSVMKTIYAITVQNCESDEPQRQAAGRWAMDIIWDPIFDDRMDDRAHVMDVFERHNEAVIATVPKDRLLVFEASQGWEPLCRFLEVDVPDEPYPRTNSSEEFEQNVAEETRR
jgi:hypothetical protein